jgi:hypothetical protein
MCITAIACGTVTGKPLGTGVVDTVGAGKVCGGDAVDTALGGTGGACVWWWKMSVSCCNWAGWLSVTGQISDAGEGQRKTLARSRSRVVEISASAEDLKGITESVGNGISTGCPYPCSVESIMVPPPVQRRGPPQMCVKPPNLLPSVASSRCPGRLSRYVAKLCRLLMVIP